MGFSLSWSTMKMWFKTICGDLITECSVLLLYGLVRERKITANCAFTSFVLLFRKLAHRLNTLRTGDADLSFYITTVQDGWSKSAFLTRACFPCTVHLIMQYIEPVSELYCWRMFIETWPHSELNFRHRASSI